mmetsp:Transcript_89883/g.162146  ORF Transcript_89883/g.162146 Transcript_89883/m.162146 type:complete len:102 (+) Transcript_89883:609-914(+)
MAALDGSPPAQATMGPEGAATALPPAAVGVANFIATLGNPFVDTRLIDKPGKFFGKKSEFSSWSFIIRGYLGLIGLFDKDELAMIESKDSPIILSSFTTIE